jgi:hypothetical protein
MNLFSSVRQYVQASLAVLVAASAINADAAVTTNVADVGITQLKNLKPVPITSRFVPKRENNYHLVAPRVSFPAAVRLASSTNIQAKPIEVKPSHQIGTNSSLTQLKNQR